MLEVCPGAEPYPEISRPWAHKVAHGLLILGGMNVNIVLVGFGSVGRTSLGRLLATELKMGFVDTDYLIEVSLGEDIASFVTKSGWEAFRMLESSILRSLTDLDGYVISTGGGCLDVMEELNLLRSLGHIIWVKAPASKILEQTYHLFGSSHAFLDYKKEIQLILRKSSPLYLQVADIVLDIGCLGPVDATRILKLAIQQHSRFS